MSVKPRHVPHPKSPLPAKDQCRVCKSTFYVTRMLNSLFVFADTSCAFYIALICFLCCVYCLHLSFNLCCWFFRIITFVCFIHWLPLLVFVFSFSSFDLFFGEFRINGKNLHSFFSSFCVFNLNICVSNLNISDENQNSSENAHDDISSPSKRTKNIPDPTSPSVLLNRLPLSPRKDLNLSNAVHHQSREDATTPNTLPKAALKPAGRPQLRSTRRNLSINFAGLTPDSDLQTRCSSVSEIRDTETHVNTEPAKQTDVVNGSLPSTPVKKMSTPLKSTPSSAVQFASPTTVSHHEQASLRLVKDSGLSSYFSYLFIYVRSGYG